MEQDIAAELEFAAKVFVQMGLDEKARSAVRRIDDPVAQALAVQQLAITLASQKVFDRALTMMETITEPYIRGQTLTKVGWALFEDKQSDRALDSAKQAADILEPLCRERAHANLLADLAILLSQLGETNRAIQALEHVLSTVGEATDSDRVTILANAARGFHSLGDGKRARQILLDARDLAARITDKEELTAALLSLAGAFANADDAEQARQILFDVQQEIVAIADKAVQAIALLSLARAFMELNDPTQSRQIVDQALAATDEVSNHSHQAALLADIALALYQLEDSPQGEKVIERALSNLQETLPGERPDSLPNSATLNAIIRSLAQLGSWKHALQLIEDYRADVFSKDTSQLCDLIWGVVEGLLWLQKHEVAFQILQAFWNELLNYDCRWKFPQGLEKVTRALSEFGQYDRAQALIDDALVSPYLSTTDLSSALAPILQPLVKVGEYDRAKQLALAGSGDQSGGQLLQALGEAFVEANQIDRALQVANLIDNDEVRIQLVSFLAKVLAETPVINDQQLARHVVDALHNARTRGRGEVFSAIGAFIPVLGKLGLLQQSWVRIQAVERYGVSGVGCI